MGFWGSVKDAASSVADTVGDVIEEASDAVTDAPEAVGNGIEDGLGQLGDQAKKVPLVGGLLQGALNWLGRTMSSAFDVVGAFVKGVSSIVSGCISGLIKMVGGIVTLDWPLIGEGFFDVGSGIAGAFVVFGGKLISFVQTLSYFLQPNERKLTAEEKQLLERVFRTSLPRYNIRLVEGFAGLFSVSSSPFTLGNTIYLKDRDVSQKPELLVHECTHVWQYQHFGARYASDAIGAQWFVEDAYDWQKEIQRGHTDWVDFNKESQAEFHEDLYTDGEVQDPSRRSGGWVKGQGKFYVADREDLSSRFVFGAVAHTDRANDAVAALRRRTSFRPSRFIP
jgi:hypothetical protein